MHIGPMVGLPSDSWALVTYISLEFRAVTTLLKMSCVDCTMLHLGTETAIMFSLTVVNFHQLLVG